jgi:rhamnopyranosyl-N-acetylglucosaminyl-diphospho-decaprenol beta-1,3/1,4-galactofuranosyltransferase
MVDVNRKYESVAAVVLAFSREEELKKVVHNLKNQTRKPDEIIVIFQGTSPSILKWLNQQLDITVHQQDNLGSAGGFTTGIKMAITKGHQWSWLLDDDAVPELNALEELVSCKHFDSTKTGYLGAVVVNPEREVYMSPAADESNKWYGTVLQDGCVPVTVATWIGCLVSSQAILDFGLPMENYFLYDEDYEWTTRVACYRNCYCVIKSIVIHYQKSTFDPFASKADMLKHGYFVRNRFATIRLSDKSGIKKIARIWLWFFKNAWEIVTGKVPWRTVIPLLSGLFFFRPKIKFMQGER